jgi:site-specific DNA recombinase
MTSIGPAWDHKSQTEPVIEALTSPRTQGLKMHNGTTVLDGDGDPIRLAVPTFDPGTWQQIQDAAALRQLNRRTPSETKNPMLGIGFCGVCGASLAQQFSRRKRPDGEVKVYRTYRCSRTPINCKGVSVQADVGDELLEETFLFQWGDDRVTRRVFVPREDHTHELQQVNERLHGCDVSPTPASSSATTMSRSIWSA